jgi:hypothetical protein
MAFYWYPCCFILMQTHSSGRQKTCAHQNDIVWTLFDPLSTLFIHSRVIFETEFVIWKGSRSQNQVKMTQYSIFYCIIDQNGLKKTKVTKIAVLWSHFHESQLIYQLYDLLWTAKFLACWLARIINHRTWSDNGGFLFPTKFSHYDTPGYFQVVHGVTYAVPLMFIRQSIIKLLSCKAKITRGARQEKDDDDDTCYWPVMMILLA